MAHRPNFPPNPYSRGMPGTGYRNQSPRQNSPGQGRGFSGSPRGGHYYNPSPRGFTPNRGPSPQHMQQHGRGNSQFSSPSHYQQSQYTPGSSPRYQQQWDGGSGGRGGRGRGRGGGYNRTPGRGRGGAGVDQYYKHSMVEDPWRTLTAKSQGQSAT